MIRIVMGKPGAGMTFDEHLTDQRWSLYYQLQDEGLFGALAGRCGTWGRFCPEGSGGFGWRLTCAVKLEHTS